jgi:hypothetical protein
LISTNQDDFEQCQVDLTKAAYEQMKPFFCLKKVFEKPLASFDLAQLFRLKRFKKFSKLEKQFSQRGEQT